MSFSRKNAARHMGVRVLPLVFLSAVAVLLQPACGTDAPPAEEGSPVVRAIPWDQKIAPELLARADRGETLQVIVDLMELEEDALPFGSRGPAPEEIEILTETRAVRDASRKSAILRDAPSSRVTLLRDYSHLPVMFVEVRDRQALESLLRNTDVQHAYVDEQYEATLTESKILVNQPAVATAGKQGAGTTVAVIDTGVDYTGTAFGSCTAPGAPGSCKVVHAQDFAPADGVYDSTGHGTNVAAIVLGVAPAAKIAALDVFGATGLASSTNTLAAINWVVANRVAHNIVAMNLSLGSGSYTSACPTHPLASAIASARTSGVVTVIASGNSRYTSSIAGPACVSQALSVGAVYDANAGSRAWSGCTDTSTAADKVTCFSNSSPALSLLAPGAVIDAGGYQMGGTSQAAPHVAGAFAVLRAAFPSEPVNDSVSRLVVSGVPVTDARNNLVKPRLDLQAAAADCFHFVDPSALAVGDGTSQQSVAVTPAVSSSGCSWTASSNVGWMTVTSGGTGAGAGSVVFTVATNLGVARTGTLTVASRTVSVNQGADTIPPTGTVTINAGATLSSSLSVTLTLAATDSNGVSNMCISNTTTCTSWEAYSTSRSWTLATADGVKTVRAWFKDARGNSSSAVSDAITVDTKAPTDGTLTATPGSAQTALAWSGFTDAGGIKEYRLVYGTSSAPALACASGTVAVVSTGASFTHTGLTNGTTYLYRLCAKDNQNHVSPGATKSAKPVPETSAPTGTVVIAGGATVTPTAAVTLTLSATDASTVADMCVSNTATCTTWIPYATSRSWTLATGTGTKSVYVRFRDNWGNANAAPVSDSIILDLSAPANGVLNATPGDAEVALSWSGFSDQGSGIASYKLVSSTSSSPVASCVTSGGTTVAYAGTAMSFTHSSLTNGTTYNYRACAVDGVGAVSTGTTKSARPAPEFAGPTGTLVISSGGQYTRSSAVTLAISASDAAGVTQMCVSNAPSCTAWIAFAASKTWTLSAGTGTKTVYVRFKDSWGNVSANPATDTIVLDSTAPANGTATATAGDAQVLLSWSGFSDALSGIATYKLVSSTNGSPASSCGAGTVAYAGTAQTFTHSSLTNGKTHYYRTCALDGAGNVSTGATVNSRPAPEILAPTGTVSIAGGAASTKTASVTLTLSATDASGVSQMCVSNTTACTAWTSYATSKTWALAGGTGTRTVNVFWKDLYGNASTSPAQDSIVLDGVVPTNGTLTATPNDAQNSLSWSGFTDSITGIASYKLVYSSAGTPAASCGTGSVAYTGTAGSFSHSSLTNGTTYLYRLCATDGAGNTSTGSTTSARPAPEFGAPIGSLTVNSGGNWTKTTTVTLGVSATDASGVSQMCLSNTATCAATAWVAYAPSKTWTLAGGDGTKTVSAWFKDAFGNVSTSAVTDSIVLDKTAPAAGTLTAVGGDGQVALSWTGVTDAGSGVESYKLVYSTSLNPTTCSAGAVAYTGSAGNFTHSGLTNGTTHNYRLCATDRATNSNAGTTRSARPAPEYSAPVGTLAINAGATNTATANVTLTLSATDASGVSQMCVSNAATCSAWIAYATSKTWTLAGGNGIRTVYVSFKDVYGNVTASPVTDTILLDSTAPTNGSLSATGADGQVALSWAGFSDAGSGLASYKLVTSSSGQPVSCSAGTVTYAGTATSTTHSSLTNGTTYYYRACALDNAGNTSTGVAATARPAPEYAAPVGTLVVNTGATWAKSGAVTLTISATDASTVSQMCLSNTASCTAWQTYATSKSWTLAAGNGTRTVYAWFKDIWNNASTTPVQDSISVDATTPANGTVTASAGSAQVALSWSGFSDATSGIASYKVVYATGTSPASCAAGTQIYAGSGTTYTHTSLTGGTLHYYRVCAVDTAGNVGTGAAKSATPN